MELNRRGFLVALGAALLAPVAPGLALPGQSGPKIYRNEVFKDQIVRLGGAEEEYEFHNCLFDNAPIRSHGAQVSMIGCELINIAAGEAGILIRHCNPYPDIKHFC